MATGFVYDEVEQAYQTGTLIGLTKSLVGVMREKAWTLAEALYYLKDSVVLPEDERFEEWAAQEFGLNLYTIKRYVSAWQAILQAPETVSISILDKEINAIIPLGTNRSNGKIGLEEVDWDRVEDIETNGEMRDMIREIRNVPERKGTITIHINGGGDLIAYNSDGEQDFIGFLEENPRTEFGRKAVERIKNYLGK